MKVLSLSSYYMHGGAGRAAARLHDALVGMGIDARLLVQHGFGDAHKTIYGPLNSLERIFALFNPAMDMLPLYYYTKRNRLPFSSAYLPDLIRSKSLRFAPDIINIHWVCGGFVRIETLKNLNRPLVWTLHDSWPFTGGCHIPMDCKRYTNSCGKCPALGSKFVFDLSRWIWHRKSKAWRELDLTLVTPSRWLAQCARESSLFRTARIEVIPNGLDVNSFQPVDKDLARKMLSLSTGKKYILFGALNATSDQNKGFRYLAPALQQLAATELSAEYEVIVFGAAEPAISMDFGFKAHYLGHLHDEVSLKLVYSAADVFMAPSIQENLPNTVMEAMACGTPCVAFEVGGIPDMIDHMVNGYLAKPFVAEDLTEGLSLILNNDIRRKHMSIQARHKIITYFSMQTVVQRYLNLYEELQ